MTNLSPITEMRDGERQARAELENIVELIAALTASKEAEDDEATTEVVARIEESAFRIEVRSGWTTNPRELAPEEYRLMLAGGGPTVWLTGELDSNREPTTARLLYSDVGGDGWLWPGDKAEEEALLEFAQCFYFGE